MYGLQVTVSSMGTALFSFNELNTFSQRGLWFDVDDNVTL